VGCCECGNETASSIENIPYRGADKSLARPAASVKSVMARGMD